MTRVLVTGANGHIGVHTVRCLLHRGHEVVPFVRRGADVRDLQGLGLAACYGDVLYVDRLDPVVAERLSPLLPPDAAWRK